jgi:hypothetical protein
MSTQELRDAFMQQPFELFHLALTDKYGYDFRHAGLLWVGLATAILPIQVED